jgi:cytochrome c-type biogenesis protein CcmH/NrfG
LLALALIGISIMITSESRSHEVFINARLGYRTYVFVAVVLVGVCLLKLNGIRSEWYADLGAVEMAQVELAAFPSNKWTDPRLMPPLGAVQSLLRSSLQYDPNNESANYHLGLISMLEQDFESAAAQLDRAHQVVPNHRGIIKKLGYCYVWLGDLDKAELLLAQIPEAKSEMEVYSWWWSQHGRPDLANRASQIAALLDS